MLIGNIGEKLDLLIRQGATFGSVTAQMFNPDLTTINLTGCIIRGKIRKTSLDTRVIADINATITDPLLGKYQYGLTAAETALIPAGENITDQKSKYVWDLELEDSAGKVFPLYYGSVTVFRELTK